MIVLEQLNAFYENMLPSEKCCELLQEYAKNIDGFVIFGAMHTGIHLKKILEKFSLNMIGFLDEYMKFDMLEDKRVFHSILDLKLEGWERICFVIATNIPKNKEIMRLKLKENFPDADILEQKVLFYCHYNGVLLRNDSFYMNTVSLINTNLCTLKCRGCCTMTPELEPELRENFPVENILRSVRQLSKVVDAINNVEIIGGEPFLHPQLDEILFCLREQPNIFQIVIDTNGTIVPKKEVIDAMAACDIVVRISDYGSISTKKQEILSALEKNNIIFFMRPVNEMPWSDYGEIYDRGSGEKQFKNCRDDSVLYKGKLYPCLREFRYVEKKLYTADECVCVDLDDATEKAREDLAKMMTRMKERTEPLRGCRFCGDMDVKIEAGVQKD